MNFGTVLELCKKGVKIARQGWNGKGMYVKITTFVTEEGIPIDNLGLIIKTPTGKFNNWIPSITDLFAEDWVIVE